MKLKWQAVELQKQFRMQLKLLASHCLNYDNGDYDFAPEIATKLRVILHDTIKSTSLLNHLHTSNILQLSDIFIADSHLTFVERNENQSISPWSGLAINFYYQNESGIHEAWIPTLGRPASNGKVWQRLALEDWWNIPIEFPEKDSGHEVIIDGFENPISANYFTRKSIVTDVSNLDGGSHVGTDIKLHYHNLTRSDETGVYMTIYKGNFVNSGIEPEEKDIVHHNRTESGKLCAFAVVRQIAHEILISFPEYIDNYTFKDTPLLSKNIGPLQWANFMYDFNYSDWLKAHYKNAKSN